MRNCVYCHKPVAGFDCSVDTFFGCSRHLDAHPEYYKMEQKLVRGATVRQNLNNQSIDTSTVKSADTPMQQQNTPRARLLEEAMKIVHHDRNANYGNPEDNFQNIANLWNAYVEANAKAKLGSRDSYIPVFTPADVAIMNMLIKVARLANNPNHHDSAVDIAGYAACLADIQESAKAVGSASA